MPSTFLSLEFVELIEFEVDGAEDASAVTFNLHRLSATGAVSENSNLP